VGDSPGAWLAPDLRNAKSLQFHVHGLATVPLLQIKNVDDRPPAGLPRSLLAFYRGFEIDNERLRDELVAFGTDVQLPESDHAPVSAEFE
jgi:hypothetical protein